MGTITFKSTQVKYKYFRILLRQVLQVEIGKYLSKVQVLSNVYLKILKYIISTHTLWYLSINKYKYSS